jgi:hypothetical protein
MDAFDRPGRRPTARGGMRAGAQTMLALLVAGLWLTACGQPSPDLFAVERTGPGAGSDVSLVVSDGGTVTCNGGGPRALDGDQVLTARELSRELSEAAALGLELPPGRDPTLAYRVRLEAGMVSFTDASRDRPASFNRLEGFVADVAENVCGIER